jgi:hypothetical protein
VPLWRWAIWWTCLGAAVVIFYVLASPIWMGLRAAAWIAEFRARRAKDVQQPLETEHAALSTEDQRMRDH